MIQTPIGNWYYCIVHAIYLYCVCVCVWTREKHVHWKPFIICHQKPWPRASYQYAGQPLILMGAFARNTHTHNTKVTWWIGTVRPNADVHTRNRIVQHEHELHSAISLPLQYIQLHTATADHKTTATNKPRARQSIHLLPFRLSGKIHSVAEMRLWYVHRTRVQA